MPLLILDQPVKLVHFLPGEFVVLRGGEHLLESHLELNYGFLTIGLFYVYVEHLGDVLVVRVVLTGLHRGPYDVLALYVEQEAQRVSCDTLAQVLVTIHALDELDDVQVFPELPRALLEEKLVPALRVLEEAAF